MNIAMMDDPIRIPKDIVVCPICGGQVIIDVGEITEDYDRTWKVEVGGFTSTCETEPDITDSDWESWHNDHFRMPYVDWLPVDNKILNWLDKNYRFTS